MAERIKYTKCAIVIEVYSKMVERDVILLAKACNAINFAEQTEIGVLFPSILLLMRF